MVFAQKQAYCGSRNIVPRAYVNFRQGDFLPPPDVCTLFANCIDNAVEAVERDMPEDRAIIVQGGVIANCMVVKFTNAYHGAVRFSDGLPVTDKTEYGHGLGLRSVRMVLERYGGVMSINTDEQKFVLIWMLPLPPEK